MSTQHSTTPKRRTQLRIKADPLAIRDDLLWLIRKDPIAGLNHPNCPADLWWELAARHPKQAQACVLYPLFTRESPERWAQFATDNLADWIKAAIEALSEDKQHLFASDCAERCLHLFERLCPNDTRPREAIRVRRLFVHGEATAKQWAAASAAAWQAAKAAGEATTTDFEGVVFPAVHAAKAAAGPRLAAEYTVEENQAAWASAAEAAWAARGAATAAARASAGQAVRPADAARARMEAGQAARVAEWRWQWARVQEYVRGAL